MDGYVGVLNFGFGGGVGVLLGLGNRGGCVCGVNFVVDLVIVVFFVDVDDGVIEFMVEDSGIIVRGCSYDIEFD